MSLDPQQPVSQQGALDHVSRGGVVVYWRPGCQFCERLATGLGDDLARVAWSNIWQDDNAREYVESLNDGNATVPTVVTRDTHFVAADHDAAERVRMLLDSAHGAGRTAG